MVYRVLAFPVNVELFIFMSKFQIMESNVDSLSSCSETTVKQIEDAFKEFTTREDIAIVLISQYVSFLLCFHLLFGLSILTCSYDVVKEIVCIWWLRYM